MKIIKIIGIVVFLGGLVLFTVGLVLAKGDFSVIKTGFSTDANYEQVEHTGTDSIKSVDIDVTTNNIEFFYSEDETYLVSYYESEDETFTFSTDGEILYLKGVYKFKFFNWNFKSKEISKINVYLPKSFNGEILCHTSTGDITINDFSDIEGLDLDVSTGDITITNSTIVGKLNVNSSTGDIKVQNTLISGDTILKTSTGGITFSNSETNSINSNSSTGSIDLYNITCDNIIAKVSTGTIKIDIVGSEDDYRANLSTNTGYIKYQGIKIEGQLLNSNGTKTLTASASTGNVVINFVG